MISKNIAHAKVSNVRPLALQMPVISQFKDVRSYLLAVLNAKKHHNPRFSIRAWSRQLGFKTPSLLIGVLNGERSASAELGEKIATVLNLPGAEREYFRGLIVAGLLPSNSNNFFKDVVLSKTKPDPARECIQADRFASMSEWHHLAVLELFSLEGASADPVWISMKLRSKISPEQALASVKLLLRLGLLEGRASQSIKRSRKNIFVSNPLPSNVIQTHHRQMIQRGLEAIGEQSIDERDVRSTKFAIKRENIDEAKKAIRECHRRLQQLSSADNAHVVFAFNSQFIQLSRSLS
jgi:uncharacterized protein (TIGR02147 family)